MQTFKVEGMTCAHCERAVTDAIHAIDKLAKVRVDLSAGLVTAESDAGPARLEAAIAAEGYQASLA